MTVRSVEKDANALTMTITAEFDAEAKAPMGTASNYFRSRDALVTQIFERISERLTPDARVHEALARRRPSRALFAEYIRDIVARLTAERVVTLALFELRLEATRNAAIATRLREWLHTGFAADVAFNEAAGLPGGAREIALFHYALDGLLFSGGGDLDPATYGAESHPKTGGVREERDRAEIALLTAALDRDMPVLAVCRGSQVLNVARGGDLVQHLPEVIGGERHREIHGEFSDHQVELEPGSRLGGLLGGRAPVKSSHHQGFGRIGDGLVVTARADDGTLEALEDPSRRFALGVLWHPEEGEDAALFRALVEEAAAYRAEHRTS